MLDFLGFVALWDGGGTALGRGVGELAVSGRSWGGWCVEGEGGREGERRARVCGCGLESSWRVRVTSSDEKVTRFLKGWGVVCGQHRTYACGMGGTWIVVVVAVVVVVW